MLYLPLLQQELKIPVTAEFNSLQVICGAAGLLLSIAINRECCVLQELTVQMEYCGWKEERILSEHDV